MHLLLQAEQLLCIMPNHNLHSLRRCLLDFGRFNRLGMSDTLLIAQARWAEIFDGQSRCSFVRVCYAVDGFTHPQLSLQLAMLMFSPAITLVAALCEYATLMASPATILAHASLARVSGLIQEKTIHLDYEHRR